MEKKAKSFKETDASYMSNNLPHPLDLDFSEGLLSGKNIYGLHHVYRNV